MRGSVLHGGETDATEGWGPDYWPNRNWVGVKDLESQLNMGSSVGVLLEHDCWPESLYLAKGAQVEALLELLL